MKCTIQYSHSPKPQEDKQILSNVRSKPLSSECKSNDDWSDSLQQRSNIFHLHLRPSTQILSLCVKGWTLSTRQCLQSLSTSGSYLAVRWESDLPLTHRINSWLLIFFPFTSFRRAAGEKVNTFLFGSEAGAENSRKKFVYQTRW